MLRRSKKMNLIQYYKRTNQISSHESAFEYFQWVLRQYNFKIKDVAYQSKGRHKIYFCEKNNRSFSFYLKYDKAWFHSFKYQFPEFIKEHPEYSGFGESLDTQYLIWAKERKIDIIVFVNTEGELYMIQTDKLLDFCQKHKLFRSQKREFSYKSQNFSGSTQAETEQTYSFPLNILINWINVWGA